MLKEIELIEKQSSYKLELDRIIRTINKEKAKLVCLQLPDGLKSKATDIAEYIESKSNIKCTIWLDSCFGACDLPIEIERLGVDLLIQFGHAKWPYKDRNVKIIDLEGRRK